MARLGDIPGLRRVLGDHQRVGFACGLVDKRPRFCHLVMFKVSPVTAQRIAENGVDVVVSSYPGTGEAVQHDAESSSRNVKGAGFGTKRRPRTGPITFRVF